MAIYYVAKDGSDANNGTSWALAKLTLAGVYALSLAAGDVIYIASGVYKETLTVGKGNSTTPIFWRGVGQVYWESPDGASKVFNASGSYVWCVENVKFKNASAVVDSSNWIMTFMNCVFEDINTPFANSGSFNWARLTCRNCTFIRAATAVSIAWPGYSTSTVELINCTFYDCVVGCQNQATRIQNCLFFVPNTAATGRDHHNGATFSDFNCYNTVTSGIQIGSYNSLADRQAAGYELNSFEDTTPFEDTSSAPLTLHPDLTSRVCWGSQDNSFVGSLPPAFVLSKNVNPTIFDDSSGYNDAGISYNGTSNVWELASGTSGKYYTPVVDVGRSVMLRRLFPVASTTVPGSVIDYSTADSAPRHWTMRWRGSNSSFTADPAVGPSWTEAELTKDVLTAYRYVQLEFTLRVDGV